MDASRALAPLLLLLLVLVHTARTASDSGDISSLRKKRAAEGFTMAFVFDSTSSMTDELKEMKKAMQEIFDHMKVKHKDEIKNFALVEFNDPYAKLLTITTDAKVYQQSLEKIRLNGGGDCPEMAMKGIKLALEKSEPNSYIFVFTDASAKDYKNRAEIDNLVQRKKSKVVFVLTGMCAGMKDPAYEVYVDVAGVSNGRVYNLLKKEVPKVLQFIKEDTEKKDLIAKGDFSNSKIIIIPVDSSLSEVTVFVGGEIPTIRFIGATGKKEESIILFDAKNARSEKLLNPKPGNLTIEMRTRNKGVYDVTTKRTFNFLSGFSLKPTNHMNETVPRPLTGKETHLLIQMTNHTNHIQLVDVKIKDAKGTVLKTLKLNAVAGKKDTYNAQKFLPPQSIFFLEVSGKDSDNNIITRILDSGISPQLPALPIITMKSEMTAKLKSPFTLTCHVESLVPFTGSWFKESVNVMPDKNFIQSAQLLYNISKTEMSSAGTYTCNARNVAGSASKSVKLIVQAPPPSVKTPKTVELKFNEKGEIPCNVQSDADFSVTWTKKGAAGSVQKLSGSKFTTKPTGNLIISRAEISDEGEYHCSASNAFGSNQSRIWVKVLQPVTVVAKSDKLKFKSQENFELSCSASGTEPIKLVLKKNGITIKNSDEKQLVLKIRYAKESDAGTYECEASNRINKVHQTLQLKYMDKPQAKIISSDAPPLAGEQYALTCLVTGSPKPIVWWTKDGKNILSKDFEQVLANGTLVIPHLYFNHTGEYKCFAKNEEGEAATKKRIDVVSKPYFDKDREEIHVDINKNVSFNCNLHGNPEPKVKWERKDGKPLPRRFSKDSSCSMFLIGAHSEDKGTYVVTAENKFGIQKKYFKLTITGMVKPLLAKGSSQESTILGQQKELTCLIQEGNPVPTISWYKDGKKLETKDLSGMKGRIFTNGSLIISYIKLTDEGTYKCEASNDAGTDVRSLNLIVNKAPIFIGDKYVKLKERLGATVRLTCEAYGKPKPKVTWMKGNTRVMFSPSILLNPVDNSILINPITKSNNGTYECIATNILGKNKKTIDLLIQEPPQISRPPSTDIFIPRGEETTLLCEVQAYPEAKIKWLKNGTPFETRSIRASHNNSSLRLTTDSSPSGEYTCLATNDAGRDQVTFNVTEAMEPVFKENQEYFQAKRGSSVTLSCIADAAPPANTYLWQRVPSPEFIEGDSTITFENVNEAIAGIYRCYASNVVGTASKTFVVAVNEPPIIDADIPEKRNIEKGSYFELLCLAHGNPVPTIRWLKNGNPLSLDDPNMLQIKSATKEDAGLYSCVAENIEGLTEKRIRINIKGHSAKK